MKKNLRFLIIIILGLIFVPFNVKAKASVSVSASNSSIEKGNSVTFYVKVSNVAVATISGTSSGQTNGCSINEKILSTSNVSKTYQTTCKSSNVGQINFTVIVNYTDESYTTDKVTKSTTINVVKARDPDSNNYLSSLSVDGYDINPSFNKDIMEYSLNLNSNVSEIKINGDKASKYSSLSGTGTFPVDEGPNSFEIKVVSETEIPRIYKLVVNVEDTNPIKVTIDGKEYTIIKNSKNLTIPNNYTLSTIKINDIDVPCFINDITKITLIALKDSEGNISYFKYDNGNYTKYIELNSASFTIYPINPDTIPYKGWNTTEITINNETVSVLKYKDLSNYYLIYGMDLSTGKYNYYLYDTINGTYQVFDEELFNKLNEDNTYYLYMLCGAAALIMICIIIMIVLSKSKKKQKINKEPISEEKSPIDSNNSNEEDSTIMAKPLSKRELKKLAKREKQEAALKNAEENKNQEDNKQEEENYNILDD
jgi:hypothetical protein